MDSFLGPNFCPFLGPIFDQKYEFGGPVFGSKFGSVFGVQNLDSLIFLIGDHFWYLFLGSKYGPKSGPPKLTKNVKKFPDRVCPEGEPDLAHRNAQKIVRSGTRK